MSIKSTKLLSRDEAMSLISEYYGYFLMDKDRIYRNIDDFQHSINYASARLEKARLIYMEDKIFNDEELEEILECIHDLISLGFESFRNYSVV